MRLRSLFTVLFAALAAATALSLILGSGAVLRGIVEDRVADRVLREMDHLAEDLRGTPPEGIDPLLRRSARELLCRITLIRPDGTVVMDTDATAAEAAGIENQGGRAEVAQAVRTGRGAARRVSGAENEARFFFAKRLPEGSVLRLSVAAARVHELESGYIWTARAAIVLACSLLFAIGTYASRRFSEPIARLTEAASAIAAGEPRDLRREGGQEVQLLAASLERM